MRPCQGSVEGRITSLDLLATSFLMHPRIPLSFSATRAHCCLMANPLFTRTPDISLQSSLPAGHHLTCTDAWGYSSSGVGLYNCSCWTSWGSSLPQHSFDITRPGNFLYLHVRTPTVFSRYSEIDLPIYFRFRWSSHVYFLENQVDHFRCPLMASNIAVHCSSFIDTQSGHAESTKTTNIVHFHTLASFWHKKISNSVVFVGMN